jgi:hypothetical protein
MWSKFTKALCWVQQYDRQQKSPCTVLPAQGHNRKNGSGTNIHIAV